MTQLFTDNALTTLAAGISAAATELTVAPGQGDNFPVVVGGSSDFFVITMEDAAGNIELIRVDVRALASDTLGSATYPLQRGFAGTTAQAWVLGDTVDLRWNANAISSLLRPTADLVPDTTNTYDVGVTGTRWRDLFLSRDADIDGALDVAGLTTLAGTTATSLTVSGLSTFQSSVDITGAVSLTLTTAGSSFINQGTTTLNDDVSIVGGNLSITGTVDGRDVSVDGTKLDTIANGAEVNPDVVPQAEAEAGVATTERIWTAERVGQAITALASGLPGGVDSYVQYNNGGAFGGDNKFTFNDTSGLVTATSLRALDDILMDDGRSSQDGNPVARIGAFGGNVLYDQIFARNVQIDHGTGALTAGRSGDGYALFGMKVDVQDGEAYISCGADNQTAGAGISEDIRLTLRSSGFVSDMLLSIDEGSGVTQVLQFSPGRINIPNGLSTSGVGIGFPFTANPSTDPRRLDDYREGTWTPDLGGNESLTIADGTYTKVGRLVHFNCRILIATLGTGSANTISGLPFNSSVGAEQTACSVSGWSGLAPANIYGVYAAVGANDSDTLNIQVQETVGGNPSTVTAFQNGAGIVLSGTYETDE